ncbi:hypothetical protein RFI_03172 [Reticulomyxa filosa]|uniref:Uncharacterized protein n=1 Tax=Reticulomyxa filosa TaxID=46433 RepID=X6P790_RETFI|nr:hypothetical protein RFI_03172 [Reticulomyxa filosa]|eukprot:ETO33924.1 hypothetical protein RFI_03172 [Reticulomyxa filosa]
MVENNKIIKYKKNEREYEKDINRIEITTEPAKGNESCPKLESLQSEMDKELMAELEKQKYQNHLGVEMDSRPLSHSKHRSPPLCVKSVTQLNKRFQENKAGKTYDDIVPIRLQSKKKERKKEVERQTQIEKWRTNNSRVSGVKRIVGMFERWNRTEHHSENEHEHSNEIRVGHDTEHENDNDNEHENNNNNNNNNENENEHEHENEDENENENENENEIGLGDRDGNGSKTDHEFTLFGTRHKKAKRNANQSKKSKIKKVFQRTQTEDSHYSKKGTLIHPSKTNSKTKLPSVSFFSFFLYVFF